MKTFFREYFYVPKDGKIKDQVMMAHVIFTTVFILLCLLAMIVTAYSHAMFNLRVESEENVIVGASFDADFYVERTSLTLIESEETEDEEALANEAPADLAFVEVEDHVYEVTFDTVGSYYIEVSAFGTAQNGFCVFEVTCDDSAYDAVYYTPSLSYYGGALSVLQFYFDVTTPATVTATSYLGSISDYEQFEDVEMMLILDGDAIPIGEPVIIPEEDMIDDPEILEEMYGEDFSYGGDIDGEPEDDGSGFSGGGGGGYTPSDENGETDNSSDVGETGDDSGTSASNGGSDGGSSFVPSGGSDSGSSSAPSGGSDSGSSSAPSGGSDGGSESAPSGGSDGGSSSASSGGSDSGSESAPSGGSDSGSSSAPSGGSDSGSSSAPSGGSDSGSSSAPSGGSDSGGSSGGGDSAPAGE